LSGTHKRIVESQCKRISSAFTKISPLLLTAKLGRKAACPPNGGQADIIKHCKKKLMSDSKILGDDSFTSKEVDQTAGKHKCTETTKINHAHTILVHKKL
jgi:hypothetical protein